MPHETLRAVPTNIWFWIAFHAGVFIALAIDLKSFKLRDRELSMRAAAFRSAVWVVLSLGFNALVWRLRGPGQALDFLTGYLIEYSLSVDNIFVFVVIFNYFRIPPRSQHRVLVWGIVGALVMRGVMIWLGVALVSHFHFVLYIFGIFLLVTAIRMFFGKDDQQDFANNWLMRLCRRSVHVTNEFREEHFTARVDGRFMLTPLALVLLLIDVMDLIFAVDSIPAVFAITQDVFIIYTSNICAILGSAFALFSPGEAGRSFHLSQNRHFDFAGIHRGQNDPCGSIPDSELDFTRCYSCRAGDHDHGFDDRDEKKSEGDKMKSCARCCRAVTLARA